MLYFHADDDSDDDEDDDEGEEEDDEGWITPGNIDAVKQATVALTESQVTDLPVACVTTDYAMQVSHCPCFILLNHCALYYFINVPVSE